MAGHNRFVTIGTLVADPVNKPFGEGKSLTKMRVAINGIKKNDNSDTLFIDTLAWNGKGTIMEKLLKKGTQVLIESKLQINEYTDKNGNKRRTPELVVDDFTILGDGGSTGMNVGHVVGTLVADPVLTHTSNGTAKCTIRLAVDPIKRKGVAGKTLWLNVIVWEKLAETCAKYLTKGKKAQFDGRLVYRQYDRTDGAGKADAIELVGTHMRMVGGRKPSTVGATAQNASATSGFGDIQDDEIPF